MLAGTETPEPQGFMGLENAMRRIEVVRPSGEGEEDSVPDLGADIAEIRKRVLDERGEGGADSLTADENRKVYNELVKRHQVDLNDEENVANLEDPSLVAHMEAARRRLAEQERALARLPQLEVLRSQYLKAMGKISSLVRSLEERSQSERENVELAHRQPRILETLGVGQKPHGFAAPLPPPVAADPATKEALTITGKKAQDVAENYEAFLTAVQEVKNDLFVVRREVEEVGDGLLGLVEASEEDRRLQREYLRLASKAEAIRQAAAPPETLGERLLAAPLLPEEIGLLGLPPPPSLEAHPFALP